MKREDKHALVKEKIHQKIDATPPGKLGVQEGIFLELEKISHQLSIQNNLLRERADIPQGTSTTTVKEPVKRRWWQKKPLFELLS